MIAKSLNISIIVFLIAATTGVTVSQHVCGDRYRYAEFAIDNNHAACCGDGTMQMDCCHNEITTNHITDAFSAVSAYVPTDVAQIAILPDCEIAADMEAPLLSDEYTTNSRDCMALYGWSVSIPVLNQSFLI